MELAEAHGVFVIEDCAQAHGSKYCGRSVGSIGHLSAWSFCQDKIMSTGGEGGMITTDNPDLWKRVWSMKDHGKLYEKMNQKQTSSSGSFRYVHDMWGTNYRLTEMQSAIGRLQLRKLDGWVKERRVNAARLTDLFQHYDNFIILIN